MVYVTVIRKEVNKMQFYAILSNMHFKPMPWNSSQYDVIQNLFPDIQLQNILSTEILYYL